MKQAHFYDQDPLPAALAALPIRLSPRQCITLANAGVRKESLVTGFGRSGLKGSRL